MLYSVSLKNDSKYGNYISVTDSGDIVSPFDVYHRVCKLKNEFKKNSSLNIKYLIFGQVMSLSKIKKWAKEEYKNLPKCDYCASILLEEVVTNNFSNNLYCSEECSNLKLRELSDKFEEEEHEFFV